MRIGGKLISIVLAGTLLLGACSARSADSPDKGFQTAGKAALSEPSNLASKKAGSGLILEGKLIRNQPVSVELSTNTPVVGETMAIHARHAKEATAKTSLGFPIQFFPGEQELVALLPISYAAVPGNYTLDVTADGEVYHYTLSVTNREFEVQYLTVDETTTKNTAGNANANAEWEQRVEPLKWISDPTQYWSGPFLQPVQGTITTEYGSIRYTNGSTVASRHSGVDIAAKRGTPVLATGNGRVLFADTLILTGNTVVIEHGYGLKSFYYHMDGLNVREGDTVEQGQQVGVVGTTGFSTGPHLHFAMAVNNVFTNPWTLLDEGLQ